MDLPPKRVFSILQENRVSRIYHSNSVITSCQFLRQRSLLSRGSVERRHLYQTAQTSDDVDKKLGLWHDVFTDSVDTHARSSLASPYGPVLFVLSLKALSKTYTGRIWVTKLNPTKWEGLSRNERWFSSAKDLEENFIKGCFDYMIVFRHSGGELPISDCLEEIILDDPELETAGRKIDYFSMAYGALKLSVTEGGLKVPIKKRICFENCKCTKDYSSRTDRSKKMFIPKV